MTIQQFTQRHGKGWEAFKRDPLFLDLISVLEELSPHKKSCKIDIATSTINHEYLLGTIAGFQSALDIMQTQIFIPAIVNQPESKFEDAPI